MAELRKRLGLCWYMHRRRSLQLNLLVGSEPWYHCYRVNQHLGVWRPYWHVLTGRDDRASRP